MQIKSQTLIIDFESVLESMWPMKLSQPNSWSMVGRGAQDAIEATLGFLAELQETFDMSKEDTLRDLSPRISTKATFNSPATIGFFQTLMYLPLPSVGGQPFWNLTMIMDIRWLDIPKARKTGIWDFGNVGTTQHECLACDYHEGKRLLAYSVCLEYRDKSQDTHRWFLSRLCLAYLGPQEYYEIDPDPRGTYIESASYILGELLDDVPFRTWKLF